MKKCIILCLTLLFTIYAYAQKSDLVRYGLKGNIKTMEQTIFSFAKQISGDWYAVDTPYYSIKTYTYDIRGVLQTMEEKMVEVKAGKTNYTITRFKYSDGKISGAEWFNADNQKLGESTIVWKDDHTYVDIVKNEVAQSRIETTHKLDNDGRTLETVSKRITYNGVEGNTSTVFTYNKGMLATMNMFDSVASTRMKYVIISLKKDELKNTTKSVMAIDPYTDNIPSILTFSKYEYYGN